ncbi:MAG TPA: hypothetical protein VFP50_15215 [Anaeromyxobacteraceae bacterium]|nr:hypothetical protein [Anaeromyxobacteraceae bacterium]
MTRAPLKHLRRSARALKAAVTSLENALASGQSAHGPEWALQLAQLRRVVAEYARLIGAERRALDEPHAFVASRFGLWCLRCGGVRDRAELHPPEFAGGAR